MKKIISFLTIGCALIYAAEFIIPNTTGQKVNEIAGVIYSKNEAALSSRSGGFISAFYVEEGDKVQKGQTLFEIDQNEALASEGAAKAAFEEAQKNLQRYKALLDKEVISQNEYEKVQIDYEIKKAALKQSEAFVKYSVVKAPFSGIVTKKNFSVGSFVPPTQPVLIVQGQKDLRFRANTGEKEAKNFSVGQSVAIKTASKQYNGKIISITNIGAMSYEIRANILGDDILTPGTYAALQGSVSETNAFVLPISVITKRNGIVGVFANANGVAKFYPIKIIQERADDVLASGVSAQMKLIISPKASITDGAKVP